MNWEHSVLNRIYKTIDFKVTNNYVSSLKDKNNYVKKITNFIDKYNLRDFKININKGGALYIEKESKGTFYFDFYTNTFFFLYTNFYEIEHKFVNNYEDYTLEGLVFKSETGVSESKSINGKVYCDQMKTYLLKLLFLREFSENKFIQELQKINNYLRFRTFIIGNDITLYDVVLLSILQIWKKKTERIEYFENNNLINLNRYTLFLDDFLQLDYVKLDRSNQNKAKDYISEGYKLNSNQELVKSVINNDKEATIRLLEQGENVNSRELKNYKSLAHLACKKGGLEMLKILIDYGCDLEGHDDEYMTPIYDAVYSQNLDLCEFLIEEMKVNIHHREIQERTPLYWAAFSGDLKMVDYLLSKSKADLNVCSKMGRSPLSKASWNSKSDIVRRLCQEKELIVNLPDNNGRYPLHNAVWGEYGGRLGKKVSGVSSTDCPEAAFYLIEAGHLLEVEDSEGYTPLMISASTNGIQSLILLIEKGGNPNHLNKHKATAIIESTRYGNAEPIETLLKYAKNVELDVRDVHGMTALEYSVAFDRIECLQVLLDHKEKNNSLNENELLSLLILSIQSNSKQSFKILINLINKLEIFTHSNYQKYIHYFKETLERVLNLSNYEIFNILCKEYWHYIELIFFSDIQLLIKATVLKVEFHIDEFEDKNGSNSDTSRGDVNKKINTKRDSNKNDEDSHSISESDNEEVKNIFKSNVDKLFLMYLDKVKQEHQNISTSFIKLAIYCNDNKTLSSLLDLINEEEDNIIEDSIEINDSHYIYYIERAKRRVTRNSFLEQWDTLLNDLNYHSLLSISIEKHDNSFDSILQYQFVQKCIFTQFKDHKNILHILFKADNVSKFTKILHIVESCHPNRIEQIITMLDLYDSYNLTPLDIIMKNKLFDLVEKYTNILDEMRVRHGISNTHNHIFYKVVDYEIQIEENPIVLPSEYKQKIDDNLKQLSTVVKKCAPNNKDVSIVKDFTLEMRYDQYREVLENKEIIRSQIIEIVGKIKKKKLENEFKLNNPEYKYFKWVDDEGSLIECANHLEKYKFIGVDLEFHGSSSEKDGIVCVLQISSLDRTYAIDTIKLRKQISLYLKSIFENDKIIKIFHGCDNDVVWLITNFGIFTKNIFDTGRAFLVFQKYILNKSFKATNLPSLNYLSKFFLNMEIDKSYQKSDWRIRPLTRSK